MEVKRVNVLRTERSVWTGQLGAGAVVRFERGGSGSGQFVLTSSTSVSQG